MNCQHDHRRHYIGGARWVCFSCWHDWKMSHTPLVEWGKGSTNETIADLRARLEATHRRLVEWADESSDDHGYCSTYDEALMCPPCRAHAIALGCEVPR